MFFLKIARQNLPAENFLFCTDDKHIADIRAEGHINAIARMAVRAGIHPVSAVRMATINTCRTYGIRRLGAIAPGYVADMVVFRDLKDFEVVVRICAGRRTFHAGFAEGRSLSAFHQKNGPAGPPPGGSVCHKG